MASGTDRDKITNKGKQENEEKKVGLGKWFSSPLHPNSHTTDYSRNLQSAGEEEDSEEEEILKKISAFTNPFSSPFNHVYG
jgi:hypothetical protein